MTSSNLPLVSIAIPTYNHKSFISQAIKTVLAQNYSNIEIVISDDASTDNTVDIAKEYQANYSDKIKILTSEKNSGASNNWYKCVQACTGKYIITLAGDDEFLPEIILECVKVMENDQNIAICYCDVIVFNTILKKTMYYLSNKTPTKSGNLETALKDVIYYSVGNMFKRDLLPKENSFKHIKHGSDLAFLKEIMIISGVHGKIYYLPKVLYKYQKHNENITVTSFNYRKEHIECIKILQNKYPHYRKLLEPVICDFCCVGLFKSLQRLNFMDVIYFLLTGIKASRGNLAKFFRATRWALNFYKNSWIK